MHAQWRSSYSPLLDLRVALPSPRARYPGLNLVAERSEANKCVEWHLALRINFLGTSPLPPYYGQPHSSHGLEDCMPGTAGGRWSKSLDHHVHPATIHFMEICTLGYYNFILIKWEI